MHPLRVETTKDTKDTSILFMFLIVSILYCLIFFGKSNHLEATWDLNFHLARIKGATTFFQSPVNFKVFHQHGYGVNWFYPFTIILPASFIFFLTGNIIFSYKVFIFLITFLTFIISYFCGKKFFKDDYASLVFSFVYGLSSFRMSELFLRADVAEMAAYSFLPMIFLGFYLMLDKNDKSGWKIFSIGICLVFFSHLLTLFICAIFLGIIFFVCIFFNYKSILNNFLPFLEKIIKSFITIIFVNLAFLIPFLNQLSFQKLTKPFLGNMEGAAFFFGDELTNSLNYNLLSYSIGILGIISILLPLTKISFFPSYMKLIFILSLVSLIMTTKLFPWFIFQNTYLNIIQFPMRFLGIQCLFGSVSLGEFAKIRSRLSSKKNENKYLYFLIILFLGITIGPENELKRTLPKRVAYINIDNKTAQKQLQEEYNADYIPAKSGIYQKYLQNDLFYKKNRKWFHNNFKVTNKSFTTSYFSKDSKSSILLPVYFYRGVQVYRNGVRDRNVTDHQGLVLVRLKKKKNLIRVTYSNSIWQKILLAISGFCFLTLILSSLPSSIKMKYKKMRLMLLRSDFFIKRAN